MDILLVLAGTAVAWATLQAVHPPTRAKHLIRQGRLRDALPLLDRSIAEHPHATDTLFLRGLVLLHLEEYERSRADFSALLQREPGHASTLYHRSIAHRLLGDADKALLDLDEAIEHQPNFTVAYSSRAMMRLFMGFTSAAAEDAEIGLIRMRWHGPAALYAAIIGFFAWRQAGQPDRAARLVEQVRHRCPAREWPWPLLQYLGRELTAGQLLEMAGTEAAGVHVHATLGLDAACDGRRDEALAHLTWVRDHGRPEPFDMAYALATEELRRLEKGDR